ncbi:hypothetical protein MKK84_16010 [Methylobacterium sp. E-065]|uniref:hypothetical protein n=1 Tax=Methylobacterium sp. E-065 TaxID=2836583 RepID=UPI001FBA797C|nr:hypothetical protein [Methylobacterium sp. E-065]MCJ2018929.1 hypothetical protein [Methylobacterium sp. E-065]
MPASPLPSIPCQATRAYQSAEHFAWLHSKGSVGRGWIGRKVIDADGDENFVGATVDLAELLTSPALVDAQYVSLNRFWGRRRSGECLKSVGNLGLDYDYNKPGLPFDGWAPEAVRDVLVEAMDAAGLPLPSIWVASGRNLQAQYACDGAKASAWERVRAVYDALHGPDLATNGTPKAKRRAHADPQAEAEMQAFETRMLPVWRLFRDAGLDRKCRDGARVLRLVGAVHAETGAVARLIHPAAFADATRHTFHALADAILPTARRALQDRRLARTEANSAADDNPTVAKPRRHAGPAGRWVRILRDLHAWRDGMGGPPKGRRELWLFLTANATAHVRGGTREDWASELAPLAGLSEKEARSALGSLDRRQRRHEAGETDEHKGVEQSALYNHKAETIVDLLDIQVEQAEAFGLRSLFPGGGKALTPAERQQARRRRLGIESASDSADRRLWIGLYALGQRTDGMSLAEICADQEIGKDAVLAAMRIAADEYGLDGAIDVETLQAARAAAVAAVAAVADVASRYAQTVSEDLADAPDLGSVEAEPVGFASRYIVGSASRDARSASDPALPRPGAVRVNRFTRVYATVQTASGTWEWLQVEGVWGRGVNHVETTLLTDPAAVSPADAALAATAFEDLARTAAKPARSVPRTDRRRPSQGRPAAVQRAPMAPLDATADRAREVELYLEASGGWGSARHRLALVAA